MYALYKKGTWNSDWEKVELRRNTKGEYSFSGTSMVGSKKARDLLVSGSVEFPPNTTCIDLRNPKLMESIETSGRFYFPPKLKKVDVSYFSQGIPAYVVQELTRHIE